MCESLNIINQAVNKVIFKLPNNTFKNQNSNIIPHNILNYLNKNS